MLLLDEVVNVTDDSTFAESRYRPMARWPPFLDAEGHLPGWFALELMAQTVMSGQVGTATGRGQESILAWCSALVNWSARRGLFPPD